MRHNALLLLFGAVLGCNNAEARIEGVLALQGDPTSGQTIYTDLCARCHDDDLSGTNRGPNIQDEVIEFSEDALLNVIFTGPGNMPAFDAQLDDQEAADLLSFLRQTTP